MQILVIGGEGRSLPEVPAVGKVRFVHDVSLVDGTPDIALVHVREPGDLDRLRSARASLDPTCPVFAVREDADRPTDEDLYEAGADDWVLSDNLERRLPFLARRRATLLSRERRLRAIIDTTVDGIIVIDETGRMLSVNPAVERIFGYTADELVGRNVSSLMPDPFRDEHDAYLLNYLRTGRRKIIGIGREVLGRRRDGSTFPMDLAVSEVRSQDGVTFTGLVRDISERRRLENEVLRISDQERRRIGQDLHDGLGQMLTGIGLISQNLARRLRGEHSPVAGEVEEITELVREADQQARSLARGLVPVELDAHGLAAAVQRLSTNAARLFGIECFFEEVGSIPLRDSTSAINLYRIAQEAVSNAVKHGRASSVRVTLASGRDQIRLRIQDNGVGFPETLDDDRGMGVRIMHYRARVIGAVLEIRNRPEGGTVITCTLPRSSALWPDPANQTSNEVTLP